MDWRTSSVQPLKREIRKKRIGMYGLKFVAMAVSIGFILVSPEPTVAAERTYEIRMESQPLERAANELADLIAKQVVLYSEDAEGIQAPALMGTFTERAALEKLLEGTGLIYRYVNDRTISIGAAGMVEPGRQDPEAKASSTSSEAIDAPPGAATAPIEEVVVTVQKRDQNPLDVPASVSVFDSAALDAYNIDSIRDISRLTPNFLGSSFTNTQPIFAIRGGSNTLSAIGTSEPVGVYIDEVYIPRFSSADFELFDLKQVEVLRGPQGTFFGRNVASGAVVVTTEKPSLEEANANAQVGLGSHDAYILRGLVSGPLGATSAGKVSVSRSNRDGYGEDVLAGTEQDNLDSTSVRASLLLQPSDRFEAILSLDRSQDENGGRTLSAIGFGDSDERTSHLGVDQDFERDIYGGSLRITYDMDSGSLISITGVRKSRSEELFSFNGLHYSLLPFAFQQVDRDTEEPSTVSQELRFVSADFGRADFIAGLFVLHEDSNRVVERRRFLARVGAVIVNQVFDQNIQTEAYAAYVDGTYRLAEEWSISAGGRYSVEDREADLRFIDNNNAARSFNAAGLQESFDAFTPRLSLTWKPDENASIYASVSRGFTAGGFNTEADSLVEITTPFKEETILSHEIGGRFRSADGRGYAYLTLFNQDYRDKQEFVFNRETFLGTILNAADATIQGVELEVGWRFGEYFGIEANYGYLETQYDSFPIGSTPGNTGNELGSSPKNQFALTLDWRVPVAGGRCMLFANVSHSSVDDYFTGATNDPDLVVPSYEILGARAGLESASGRWRVELWGSNLLDEDVVLIPSDFIVKAKHLGAPQLFGAKVMLWTAGG